MSHLSIPSSTKPAMGAIAVSWIVLAACLSSPLIELNKKYITSEFLLFAATSFFAFYFSFFIGTLSGKWKKFAVSYKFLLYIAISAAIISVSFRFIDRFYLRPVTNYFSIADVRGSRSDGSNFFSIASVLLLPIAIALYLKIKSTPAGIKKHHNFLFISFFSLAILDVASTGSRGILLCLLIFIFYKKITPKTILIIFPTLIILSGLFFIVRFSSISATDDIQATLIFVSTNGYAEFVPATQYSEKILSSDMGQLFFPLIQANQYFAHGIFEYGYQYKFGPEVQFDPSRIIPQLSKISSFTSSLERQNLYYTAPGSFYIAFGKYSILALSITGLILGIIYKRAIKESSGAKGIVLFSIFLTPFVNNIAGFDLHFYLIAIYITSSIKIKNNTPYNLSIQPPNFKYIFTK